MIRFTKMHGLGNDFVLVDCLQEGVAEDPSRLAVRICDRHLGVGADGLIIVLPSSRADFRMRIFNADGSEAEMCGNGIRCLAKYIYERGLTSNDRLVVETLASLKELKLRVEDGVVQAVTVNLGRPGLSRKEIPVLGHPDSKVVDEPLTVGETTYRITCVSLGNPHTVIFVEDVDRFPVTEVGPRIENHGLFPQRTNVEFVQLLDGDNLKMRVWERGCGETLACGSGATAAAVASILLGQTSRRVKVHLAKGVLEVEWGEDGDICLTGPAEEVFRGEWLL